MSLQLARSVIPRGEALPEDIWWGRHRGMLILLWVHAAVVPLYALIRGFTLEHALAEAAIIPVLAAVASHPMVRRRFRTGAASVGLLTSSAILVHLSGGLIEMHFHFFVMVAVVALYQDWIPFLTAIGYVLIHHGLMGAIDPRSVYNHPAAWNSPWKWAAIHAFFVTGISIACMVTWRANEMMLDQRRAAEERLRQETRIVETLHEVGKAVAAELDLETVVNKVVEVTTSLTGAAFGAFFYNVIDEHGEEYMLYNLSGAPKAAFESLGRPRNTKIFEPTFAGRGVVRLDDVTADDRYGQNPPYHGMPPGHLPVRSYLAVPVRSRTGEVLGGLFFGHPEVARFTEEHERIVTGIASTAAVAIDNARLYEAERRSLLAAEQAQRRLEVLAEASRVLAASMDVKTIADKLASLIVPAVADGCTIELSEEGRTVHTVSTGAPTRSRRDDSLVMAASLRGRSGDLGSLTITLLPERKAADDHVSLLEELARRASVAIENARMFSQQRTLAETLQHSLLPERLPQMPGLEIAYRYRPGGPGVDVGGDWYDVVELPRGGVALIIGDVVGRGAAAASLMGQIRNALRAYAVEIDSPAEVLASLNTLVHDVDDRDMATVIYMVYDLETGTLRYANAGHPPPLVISQSGEPQFLNHASGLPIGPFAMSNYRDAITSLEPGATLVLYTDGLVEEPTLTLDEGLDRLSRAAGGSPTDVESLCDRLLADAASPASGGHDDVALLVVRSLPLGERISVRIPSRPESLRSLRATLRRWLVSAGTSEEETYEIVTAVGEACANAIQHATGPSLSDFELEGVVDGDISVTIRDQGTWRTPGTSGNGGRGFQIMDAFMDTVSVDTSPDGTTVTLRRQMSGMSRA